MRHPLARLLAGWLLMLAGGGLMLDSGLTDLRTSDRTLRGLQALVGLGLAGAGAFLRRSAVRPTRP